VVTGKAAKVEVQTLQPKPTEDPMTDERMALVELLQKSGDGDFLRAVAEPEGLDLAVAHPIYPAPGATEENDAVSVCFRRGISPTPADAADLAA
jgi:hypothetical protein